MGKVARWLVMLGYDARFVKRSERPDKDIAAEALKDGRVLLTRDTRMPPVKGLRIIVVREQRFEDQLRRVFAETGLKPERSRLFSRCTECNEPLDGLSRDEALPLVPPLVRELETPFFRCPSCRRVFWSGTHVRNTIEKLERMGL